MRATNDTFREARQRLGLTQAEVAHRSGLTVNEYGDLEQHEDEAARVVHLRNLKLVCEVLRLDLLETLGLTCAFCDNKAVGPASPRSEMIRGARTALGLSQAELGDRLGFEPGVVVEMEGDPSFLDGWSAELVMTLAGILHVPAQALLDIRCNRCGR